MNGAYLDSLLAGRHAAESRQRALAADPRIRMVATRAANLRVLDTGGNRPALLLTPDGPCVIEHCLPLIEMLAPEFRVLCFDMPGFGFSYPRPDYRFGLNETGDTVIELMDALGIAQAVLAFSCANGFFAMNAAQRYPQRVSHLVLAQTPSPQAMQRWTKRIVPAPLKLPYLGQLVMAATARKFATSWFDLSLPRESAHKAAFAQQARHAVESGGCFCLASLVQSLGDCNNHDLQGVQCPTLLYCGDNDFSHKYTDFESLKDVIPQAEIRVLSGCGHFPDLERSADYASGLKQFVAA